MNTNTITINPFINDSLRANFDVPFRINCKMVSDTDGILILGNYCLRYSLKPLPMINGDPSTRGCVWSLGDLMSFIIYIDDNFTGVTLSNVTCDKKTGVITANWLFNVQYRTGGYNSNIYIMKFSQKTGKLSLTSTSESFSCKLSHYND